MTTATTTANLPRNMGSLEALLRCCPEAIIVINADGNISIANQEACSLLQRELRDILGKSITIVYEDLEAARETNRELYRHGGIIRDYRTRIKTKSGRLVPVRVSACHRLDADGNYLGAVGIFEQFRPWSLEETRKKFKVPFWR